MAEDNVSLADKLIEQQMIVLSGLLKPSCDMKCLEVLHEGCFNDLTHRELYRAIKRIHEAEKEVNIATLFDQGIPAELILSLTDYAFSVASTPFYAERLALWTNRLKIAHEAMLHAMELKETALGPDDEYDECKINLTRVVTQETSPIITTDYTIEEGMGKLMSQAFEQSREPILFTAIPSLDDLLAPMVHGKLIVVGALTSMGKTALSLQIVLESANKGTSCGFVSMETGIEDLIKRCISNQFGLPGNEISGGDTQTWSELYNAPAYEKWLRSHVRFIDNISSFDKIEVQIRRWYRQHGARVVVIDYLGLINPIVRDSQTRDLEEKTRRLKVLAMELGIVIILLAQLNRESVRANRPARISDLRGSASLEHDADAILLLLEPDDGLKKQLPFLPNDCKYLSIFVGKCRTGPRDFCLPVCVFDGVKQRIKEL